MKNIFSLQKSKRLFIIGIITLFLSNCGITNNLSPSKQYSGLFSYLATYSYNQNNSFIQLTGTLTGEDGSTPLSGGILYINFNLFSNLSKSAMDTRVNTDSSGNFSMNLNIGNFTVQVYNSSNEYLGSFTMDITSNSIPPTPKINGKFGLINLIVKPINPFENSCGSICGYIAGVSNSLDRLFVYGMEKNNPVIYESLDGETFSKTYIKLGDCISSYNSSSPIDCKVSAVGYENGIYVVLGAKVTCSMNTPCNVIATYYGMGPSLSTIVINSINPAIPPSALFGYGRTFIFSNGYFNYLNNGSFGNPSFIYKSNDGITFNSYQASSNGGLTNTSEQSAVAKASCNDLFFGEENLAFCGLKAYLENGIWNDTTATVTTPTTDINLIYTGSYNKGTYQYLSHNNSNNISKIYSTIGSLIRTSSFTLLDTGFSFSGYLTPIYSNNLYLISLGLVFSNQIPGSFSNVNLSVVRSADFGTSYTLFTPSFPTVINNPIGLGSIGNNFFFTGMNQSSSNFSKSYLLKSIDGVNWTTVILP
jgi:hypothetical protein